MKKRFSLVLILLFCVGCAKDARIKRATSLLNVKTQVATKEYKAAPDDKLKVKVADEFFRNAADYTQVVDDYMHGREPAKPIRKEKIERPDLPND